MAKIKFIGPEGQVNYSVGLEVGDSSLKPNHVYDLPNDLAKSLLNSSSMWAKVQTKDKEDN